jgi:hypothetical protein
MKKLTDRVGAVPRGRQLEPDIHRKKNSSLGRRLLFSGCNGQKNTCNFSRYTSHPNNNFQFNPYNLTSLYFTLEFVLKLALQTSPRLKIRGIVSALPDLSCLFDHSVFIVVYFYSILGFCLTQFPHSVCSNLSSAWPPSS